MENFLNVADAEAEVASAPLKASSGVLYFTQFHREGWGIENVLCSGKLDTGSHQVSDRRPPSHRASKRKP
jgi:hypothetical protein